MVPRHARICVHQMRVGPGPILLIAGLAVALACSLMACEPRQPGVQHSSTGAVQTIQDIGSDTLVNLALAWAEAYMQLHTEVRISVTGGGSGTGINALINGTVDIANASRQIKSEEIEAAQAAGYDPQEFIIARDAIAIIVHPTNPVDRLTLEQISAIYSGELNVRRQWCDGLTLLAGFRMGWRGGEDRRNQAGS